MNELLNAISKHLPENKNKIHSLNKFQRISPNNFSLSIFLLPSITHIEKFNLEFHSEIVELKFCPVFRSFPCNSYNEQIFSNDVVSVQFTIIVQYVHSSN